MKKNLPEIRLLMQEHNPHKYSACVSFLRVYRGQFIKNFDGTCSKFFSDMPEAESARVKGEDLFSVIFDLENRSTEANVRAVFKGLVRLTPDADLILNSVWLRMIDDFMTGLRNLKGRVVDITDLIMLIHELSRLLDEAFFELSRSGSVEAPVVDTATEQHREIVSGFKEFSGRGPDDKDETGLKIRSFYHCIPVDMNAAVNKVEDESVTFNIHPYSAVALSKNNTAYITSSHHDHLLGAVASRVDLKKRLATFTLFSNQNDESEKREFIRTDLHHITAVTITAGHFELKGFICDISEVACNVYVRNAEMNKLKPGAAVRFVTELCDASGDNVLAINTEAAIFRVYRQGKSDKRAFRIVLRHDNDGKLVTDLARFVLTRQSEILRELKELSEGL